MCVCVHLLLQIIIPEYYILQADCASRVVSTPDVYERRYWGVIYGNSCSQFGCQVTAIVRRRSGWFM